MSKINAIRLINLNYNNNAIRISDETFQLGGQSTLLSLRNGGGKSVLVQMISAPFVHKQYRKTKDRPFESYFTTAQWQNQPLLSKLTIQPMLLFSKNNASDVSRGVFYVH